MIADSAGPMVLTAIPASPDLPIKQPILISPDQVATGFREGMAYTIAGVPVGHMLRIDDEPLQPADHHIDNSYLWAPDFYAGQVNAELVDQYGNTQAHFSLDVSPHPDKLGQTAFLSMVDEIREWSPEMLLGSEPGQTWAGAMGSVRNPFLHYMRLRTHGEAFVKALRRVSANPLRTLRQDRQLVSPQFVRRGDVTTALSAFRSAAGIAVLHPDPPAYASEVSDTRVLLDVPVAREELDSPANRALAAVLNTVILRTRSLVEHFDQWVSREENGAGTPLERRWNVRRAWSAQLLRALRSLQRREPFRSVTRASLSAEGLTAMSVAPDYASAYRLGWRMLRSGIDGPDAAERIWLSPTWEIYERWCYVKMSQLIRHVFPEFEWRVDPQHPSGAEVALLGTGDQAFIELLLQPRFPSGDQSSPSGLRSISGERRPDFLLRIRSPKKNRSYVLDAKYRTTRRNVLDAMVSAHIYHDALRIDDERPNLALLLIPAGGGAPWLEDESFAHREGVGIVRLTPDAPISGSWLAELIAL